MSMSHGTAQVFSCRTSSRKEVAMEYRVWRKEYVKKRPEWMTRFQLTLSPVIYEGHRKKDEAFKVLEEVKQKIRDFGLDGYKGRLQVLETQNAVIIANMSGKKLLRFRVERK